MSKSEPLFAHLAPQGAVFERPNNSSFDPAHQFFKVEAKVSGISELPEVSAKPVKKDAAGNWVAASDSVITLKGNELITLIEGNPESVPNTNAKVARFFQKLKHD